MILVGLILPDHHHYHIDHHLYHRRGCFCQSLFWWAWVLAVWVDRRKGGKVKSCSLIVIISSQALFSDHRLIFIGTNTVWSTYHDDILINQGRYILIGKTPMKNTDETTIMAFWSRQTRSSYVLWSSSYRLKLCSLIILLASLGQTSSDQRTMMAFWSVKWAIIIISSLEKHRVIKPP